MIVPRTRLLFWVATIGLPFALLAAVVPASAAVALWLIGGLVLLALADAVGAAFSLQGIGLELPPVVRLSKDRPGKL